MDEDKQIETAQVEAMNAEYEKLRKQAEKNISIYLVVINKKTGECKITPFETI